MSNRYAGKVAALNEPNQNLVAEAIAEFLMGRIRKASDPLKAYEMVLEKMDRYKEEEK